MPRATRISADAAHPELFTTGQAAKALGVKSVNTVKNWVRRGTLTGFRRGSRTLISRESIADLQARAWAKHGTGSPAPTRGQSGDVLAELRQLPGIASKAERARLFARTISEIKRRVTPLLHMHGIESAFLFGSAARGRVHSRSDIDIAVRLPDQSDMDLIKFAGLALELQAVLGRRVDLVSVTSMKPRIRERAEGEQVALL